MNLSLDPKSQKLITQRIESGKYTTAEEVVSAALQALEQHEQAGDFEPGEWDALLAEGEASGEPLDGITVLSELRALRNRRPSKAG
jgi:putative addiction module CopG family antidote